MRLFIVAMATARLILTAPALANPADTAAIKAVLADYQAAIERLDARDTAPLFEADSQILESGSAEGVQIGDQGR